jgi:hypothetical protein
VTQRINIIYKTSVGKVTGLKRDAMMMQAALSSQYQIHHYPISERKFGLFATLPARLSAHLQAKVRPFDVNIFLETVQPHLLHLAQLNLLIPNQELFGQAAVPLLDSIDSVLCKTAYAEQIFAQLTPRFRQIGFTAQDRKLPDAQPDYSQFFHLAGKSHRRRGTAQILRFWKAYPDLPKLTVVAHTLDAEAYADCPNIQIFSRYLADDQIRQLQNQIGLHICLSEAEGFGHFMAEAMSAQACVITTNAPPMNELVDFDRGYLVNWSQQTTLEGYFDQRFHFDPAAFEATIWQLVQTSEAEKSAKGAEARRWYERQQQRFQQNLLLSLDEILAASKPLNSSRLGPRQT